MTVFFRCPKPATPSGGVWFIHRIVQLLNELDIPARVWTPEPFEVWWDANPIPGELIQQGIRIGQGDTLVVPEVNWPVAPIQGVRNILFVQNYVWLDKAMYFSNPGEVLVCSRYLFNHMRRVFDSKVIGKITPFLDEGVWHEAEKVPNKVLVMARRTETWKKMVQLLSENDFQADIVDRPLTQVELSERFSTCEYYVHLIYPEGFPMACLEAMRSGTVVVGTTGGGGVEMMHHQETAVCVQNPEDGQYFNDDEFCNRIIEQLLILRSDAEKRNRIKNAAMEWSKRYTAEATKVELKAVFG